MKEKIVEVFLETIEEMDGDVGSVEFSDELILLESGLDSLGMAILVTKLDEELGFDPFVLMKTPVYPVTFGEFVSIYEKFSS